MAVEFPVAHVGGRQGAQGPAGPDGGFEGAVEISIDDPLHEEVLAGLSAKYENAEWSVWSGKLGMVWQGICFVDDDRFTHSAHSSGLHPGPSDPGIFCMSEDWAGDEVEAESVR